MVLYQKGETAAFDTIYRRYSGKVYGFIKNRTSKSALTDDIFQGIFVKLHRSKDQFDPSLTFKAWLFTICRTVIADSYRDRQKIETVSLDQTDFEFESPKETESEFDAVKPLAGLPEKQRRAIEFRYFEELSFDEIAQRLGTSPHNVRQLISRGVRNLKKLLIPERGQKNDK